MNTFSINKSLKKTIVKKEKYDLTHSFYQLQPQGRSL